MPFDPITGSFIANIATNAAKIPLSIYQMVKAAQLKRDRPEYDIPKEVMENQNMARNMAMQGLPAAQYNRGQANIDRNTAFGLRQSNSRRGGLVGLAGMEQAANDAYNNLDVADANARRQNQQGLMQQNQNVAQYRDKQFQLNELEPWQIDMQAASAMQGAAIQNLFHTANSVNDSIGQYQLGKLFQGLYGAGGNPEAKKAETDANGNPVQNNTNQPNANWGDWLNLYNAFYKKGE
jgi:hypothetical protein